MEKSKFDLEIEKMIADEFGDGKETYPVTEADLQDAYEKEFEEKKKLIQNAMQTLFVCILLVIILIIKLTQDIQDPLVNGAILVAALLSVLYIISFVRKWKKRAA